MIKKLKISNFKTHSRTILPLHPGLNAILGLPNRGKSNIRKSLEWLYSNPARIGTYKKVRSKFSTSKFVKVQVTLDNDDTVSLKTSQRKNQGSEERGYCTGDTTTVRTM